MKVRRAQPFWNDVPAVTFPVRENPPQLLVLQIDSAYLTRELMPQLARKYFAAGDYSSAMKYYDRVTKEFGESNKAPDAMFKAGLAF